MHGRFLPLWDSHLFKVSYAIRILILYCLHCVTSSLTDERGYGAYTKLQPKQCQSGSQRLCYLQ